MAGILYYCGFSSSRRLKLSMPKDNLEKNLSELLYLSKKLREANKDLRNKNSKLNLENKNLKEKLELTKNKIENLINKLESI